MWSVVVSGKNAGVLPMLGSGGGKLPTMLRVRVKAGALGLRSHLWVPIYQKGYLGADTLDTCSYANEEKC